LRPSGDYGSEMIAQSSIDDVTAEALLTGRAVGTELEPLAEVVRACRRIADRPVPPTAELAHQMSVGLFTRSVELVPRLAGRGRRRRRREWRRGPLRTAVVALSGAGALVVGVGTAGYAGVLPEPAQDRFETVLESVTPFEVPERGRGDADPGGPDPSHERSENAEFGEDVSEDARDGGVDGDEVSEQAREQGDEHYPPDDPAQVPAEQDRPRDRGPRAGKPPAPPRGGESRPIAPPGG
jgi:hypothetical protein